MVPKEGDKKKVLRKKADHMLSEPQPPPPPEKKKLLLPKKTDGPAQVLPSIAQPAIVPPATIVPLPKKSKLSEILARGGQSGLADKWAATRPAPDFAVLPPGRYVARIARANLDNNRKGTPRYKIEFVVVEGEFAGRRCWHDIYLTGDALEMAKRDLEKLGINDLAQLDLPLPEGMVCELDLVVRTFDDGGSFNNVRNFRLLRIEPPKANPFPPHRDSATGGSE